MAKDEETTQPEEKLTIKSLKKELDAFKEEVFKRLPPQPLPIIHGLQNATNPDDVRVPKTPAEKEIIFHFHDRFTGPRTFSEEINGEDWRELANNFQNINQSQIKKREDK